MALIGFWVAARRSPPWPIAPVENPKDTAPIVAEINQDL
jgi:hypothetical protein